MVHARVGAFLRPITVVLVCSAMLLIGLGQGTARATVTAVSGGAYGHYFFNGSFFGVPQPSQPLTGPAPAVTLPSGGSPGTLTAHANSSSVTLGPATIFSSGALDVSTQGTIGANGSVTSSATIQNVNTSQSESLTATTVASTCTSSEASSSRLTTISNGTLQTSDAKGPGGTPTSVVIPANPAPNTTYQGTVANDMDSFIYVFNEQVANPDGSITVNAAHEYLLGPTAKGELIIGQSRCGVNPSATPPPPPPPSPPGGGSTPNNSVPPGSTGGGSDTSPPGVSSYRMTNTSFVVTGSSTPTFGSAARRAPKRGTTFKYTLSESGTVRIVISQRASGRRRGKSCVAPTRSLRNARKCTRLIRRGTLTRTSKTGTNSVAFSGRIGSKALSPGSYSATITATDAAKNTGASKTVSFVIVKG